MNYIKTIAITNGMWMCNVITFILVILRICKAIKWPWILVISPSIFYAVVLAIVLFRISKKG